MPALAELRQHLLAVPAVARDSTAYLAMLAERQQRLLGHGVDRVGRGQRADIKHVGRLGILGPRAGEEQTLRTRAVIRQPLPAVGFEHVAIGLVGLLADGHAEFGRAISPGTLSIVALSQRLMNSEATERTSGLRPAATRRSRPAHVGVGGGQIMLAGEQQRDVDRHAGEDRLFDRGRSLLGAGNLDEQIGAVGLFVQRLGRGHRRLGVVGQQRRHLERHPAIDGGSALVDRREQVGGAREVFDRQLEEQRLVRKAAAHELANFRIVRTAVRDRVVEDGRVRGQAGDRQIVDVALERAAIEQVAGDVVEP